MKKKMYVVVIAGPGKRLKFTFSSCRAMNCFFADVRWLGLDILKNFKKVEAATQKRSS